MVNQLLVTYDTSIEAFREYIKKKTDQSIPQDCLKETLNEISKYDVYREIGISIFGSLKFTRNEQDIYEDHLFNALKESGVEVIFHQHDYDGDAEKSLESFENACEIAPLIIHSTPKVGAFQCMDDEWRTDYQKKVEDLIYSRFLWKTDFHSKTKEVTDKRSTINIAKENRIPVPKTWSMEKYLTDIRSIPVLFKQIDGSGSRGIYFIDRKEQQELFFNEEAHAAIKVPVHDMNLFDAQEYINTPSRYYTSYRIITLANGEILGCVLGVSKNNKDDNKRRTQPQEYSFEDTQTEAFQKMKASIPIDKINNELWGYSIYEHVLSPLYMGFRDIFSNYYSGGKQIAITRNEESKAMDDHEKNILAEHGIDPENVHIPIQLEEMAKKTAKVFSKHGVLYTGQDWLQDRDNNFYLLEINSMPGVELFNTIHNYGRAEQEDKTLKIGTKKIAEAIKEYTPQKQIFV